MTIPLWFFKEYLLLQRNIVVFVFFYFVIKFNVALKSSIKQITLLLLLLIFRFVIIRKILRVTKRRGIF